IASSIIYIKSTIWKFFTSYLNILYSLFNLLFLYIKIMIIKCVVFNDSKFIAGKYNNEKIGYKYLNGSGYYICEMLNNEYLWIKKYPYIINDFDVNDCGIYIIGNILVKYNNGISWKKKIDGKKISINNCNIYLLGNDNSII